MATSDYRGSPKHKNRPGRGRKGTLCPEWAHETAGRARLADDNSGYPWKDTQAHLMFEASEPDPSGSGKRYATARGIAFAAVETNDGTWHGYPEPWDRVPPELVRRWLREKKVMRGSLRRYKDFPDDNIRWALDSDDE